jgi:hypothetical protein
MNSRQSCHQKRLTLLIGCVDRLLLLTRTKDCAAADALIGQQETLILERLELQDLRSFPAFTQVTCLS